MFNATDYATLLDESAERLQRAARINRGELDDWIGFISEEKVVEKCDV